MKRFDNLLEECRLSSDKFTKKTVLKSSAVMAAATFMSRILGLVREQALAYIFGASGVTDAFNVAYRIPNMLRDLFAEGAFSPAFVPVFTGAKNKDLLIARRLLWSVFLLLVMCTLFCAGIMIVFAPEIVSIIAPKFKISPEKFEITVNLLRIMAPFITLISIAALFMGALNTLKIFFVPALAPAFFNVVMILSILFLPKLLKRYDIHGIYALGIGVIAGGIVQILVQIPLIIKKHLGPLGPIALISDDTKTIFTRVSVGSIGIAANKINVIINTMLATGTVVGAVSWLNYGLRLFQFPLGILGVSIAGSNLVHFADSWKKGEPDKAISFLKTSYLLSLFTIMWALSMLYAMSSPTIHLIFERGAFDRSDTLITSSVLNFYLVGLPFYALYKIFVPIFFTLDRPKIPVIISIISILFNIIFCVSLVPYYGFKILALGVSFSMILNALIMVFYLKSLLHLKLNFFINLKLVKIILASLVTCFVTKWLTSNYFIFQNSFINKSLMFIFIGLIGTITYCVVLLSVGEGKILKKILLKK